MFLVLLTETFSKDVYSNDFIFELIKVAAFIIIFFVLLNNPKYNSVELN